jgi:LacI family transcriptional regulator
MNLATRQRVRAVAEHLNYRPMAGARALARGRTNTVGVVFATTEMQTSSFWFGQYAGAIEAISEALDSHDYGMSLVTWSDEKEELHLPRLFREVGVDGFIILNSPDTPALERILQRHGKPYMAMDAAPTDGRVAVAVDELRAVELAVEHLIKLGHRRIAYAPLADTLAPFVPLRQELFPRGYVRAMAAAGLAPLPGWDQPQEFTDFLAKSWSTPEPPTALIVYDDTLALDAMRWFYERGIAVPKDVSVVALQDNGFAAQGPTYLSPLPDITCMTNMRARVARLSVEKLLEFFEFPNDEVDSVLIPPILKIRRSSGPCPTG